MVHPIAPKSELERQEQYMQRIKNVRRDHLRREMQYFVFSTVTRQRMNPYLTPLHYLDQLGLRQEVVWLLGVTVQTRTGDHVHLYGDAKGRVYILDMVVWGHTEPRRVEKRSLHPTMMIQIISDLRDRRQ